MASQEEATVSPRGSPRNQKCGLNPNDPEDVRNFGGLLIDITTTKADYVLPFPITSLIIFTCYQVMDDLQKDEFFRKDINKIYCLIGFITNGVSNFVKSRPDIKDSIDRMSEKELEDGIYPQILEMLQSPPFEGKSGGKRKGKKTQKHRRRGGMLSRFGKMGSRATTPFISAAAATVRSTYRLAGAINNWLPEIITVIWVLWNLFWFLYYVRLIRVKTGSALTPNDPVFTEFVKNITLGVKSGDYPILDPNVTSALVPLGNFTSEMQIYTPGETRVEEFMKNAKYISSFFLGQILSRQYSFGNALVSSVQSVETLISVPGPNEMSKKLFRVVIKGMADDCFGDVSYENIIAESDYIAEIIREHAPLLAPYSQQFTDSIKAALPSDIEVSAERIIQGPPKLPGVTATDFSNLEEEGDLEDEDEDYEVVEEEIAASSELKPKENTGGISGFFNGIIETVWASETGKKASDVITVMERQSVLYSNPEIRGQCMLESAENMRKTIELEAQLLVVNLGRVKTKFKTIWSMEKENAAKAIYHLWQLVGALTFYTGIKTMTRRAAPPAAPPAAAAPDDDDDYGDMGANALVPTGRGVETRSFGTQIASFADTGTSPMTPRAALVSSLVPSSSASSSSSLVPSSSSSSSLVPSSSSSSSLVPSSSSESGAGGESSPRFLTQGKRAPVGRLEKKIRGNKSPSKGKWLNAADAEKGNSGGRRTRRRVTQTKKRRRPIKRRQTRKLRRNTKRRRM